MTVTADTPSTTGPAFKNKPGRKRGPGSGMDPVPPIPLHSGAITTTATTSTTRRALGVLPAVLSEEGGGWGDRGTETM